MAVEIRIGDALEQLRQMPPESVHCCVTSPPYWGLRDYGTASWDGGDPDCDHSGVVRRCDAPGRNDKQSSSRGTSSDRVSRNCIKCGASRIDHQIGLEETPDEWCARLVEVFREVKRVLRDDGTLWCNVGDAYSSGGNGPGSGKQLTNLGANMPSRSAPAGYKPKDLIGQPWLLAFALRADGWFLRDAIVWAKPNPMPESVKDRCTNAYEHVFLLAKSPRYFFDAEAIREKAKYGFCLTTGSPRSGRTSASSAMWRSVSNATEDADRGRSTTKSGTGGSRNCRNVWTIATEPFAEAHFATFPTELARRCILAGTSSKGVCAECGAPWVRTVEPTGRMIQQHRAPGTAQAHIQANGPHGATSSLTTGYSPEKVTTGWEATCQCDAGLAQATVLDPFGGAGTTALVADRLQRNAVLIELNAEYAAMARRRIDGDRGDLLDIIEQPKPEQGSLCLTP